MRFTRSLLSLSFIGLVSTAGAQQVCVADPYNCDYSPRAKQLVLNESKINVVLKMDRPLYFTGESAVLTITLMNPTPGVLEVRDPSDERGPVLDLMSRNPKWMSVYGSEWGFLSPHPRAIYVPKHPNPPSVFLPSGHSLEHRFRTHDKLKGSSSPILAGGAPEFPGEYRLAYTYGQNKQASVDFKVIQPKVVAYALLTSPRTQPHVLQRDKRTVQLQRSTFVLVFEGDGAYWVLASLGTGPIYPRLIIDKNGHFAAGSHRSIGQFIRVARGTVPIVAVGGSLDASENLTITWRDQTGKTSTIELDKDRKPRGNTGPLP